MNPKPKRTVVHVPRRFTDLAWGGTERVLEQTLPELEAHGFTSSVYTTKALDDRVLGQVAGFPICRFSYFYGEWPLSPQRKLRYDNKGGDVISPSLARSLEERRDLDLVHLHTGNLLATLCLRAAQARGVPSVITLHGGHFAIPPEELKSLAGKAEGDPKRGLPWGRALHRALGRSQVLRAVDAIVCVGADEFSAAKEALPDQRVLFLPGGVNIDDFERADRNRGRALLKVPSESKLVVCVARVDRQKDQATLVKAWAKHCEETFDLAIVGPETSPGYAQELAQLARAACGRLILTGGVDPSEAPHIYAAADISVLPSRHEPFGLTCVESWAAGTPLVAANVGGPGWLLQSEREGCLFPVGDAQALGVLLDRLLRDPEHARGLAKVGRDRVRREFTWQIRAQRLATLYEEVLAKRQKNHQYSKNA